MDAEEDTQHPPLRDCISNTHVARGKVSSEYTAALADKVIIKKKDLRAFSLLFFFKERRSFPLSSGIAALYYLHRTIHH
jgi:hypothetical protein